MPWELYNDRPIYTQLVEIIEYRILSEEYHCGERIPSVRELASEAAVNPNTMQKALQELERLGLIVTNRTSGRTITEDKQLIENTRQTIAKGLFSQYVSQMKILGFSDSEISNFIKNEERN